VIDDGSKDARYHGAPADHAPGIGLRHRLLSQHRRGMPRAGAKQPALKIFGDAGGIDVAA
jgi:hypothetical protein